MAVREAGCSVMSRDKPSQQRPPPYNGRFGARRSLAAVGRFDCIFKYNPLIAKQQISIHLINKLIHGHDVTKHDINISKEAIPKMTDAISHY